jgi:hypothetical protein
VQGHGPRSCGTMERNYAKGMKAHVLIAEEEKQASKRRDSFEEVRALPRAFMDVINHPDPNEGS